MVELSAIDPTKGTISKRLALAVVDFADEEGARVFGDPAQEVLFRLFVPSVGTQEMVWELHCARSSFSACEDKSENGG